MIGHLTLLDIVFLLVILISFFWGIVKGLVQQLFSIAFLILAIVFSFMFYKDIAAVVVRVIHSTYTASFIAFMLIFITVICVGVLVTFLLRKLLIGPLKTIDRLLGGLFGMLRGILICTVMVLALVVFTINDSILLRSFSTPYLIKIADVILSMVPDQAKKEFNYDQQKRNRVSGTI